MNTFNIYFLYDNTKNLLYVGKSLSLKNRLMSHFSKTLLETESWKKEVDQENIIIYHCTNDCDLEIYETYFINKYKPKYNKDKVFTNAPSFELPYLIPETYNLLKEKKAGNSKTFIKAYCEDKISFETVITVCPLLDEAKDYFTKEDYKRLGYQSSKIKQELNNRKLDEIITNKIQKQFKSGFHLAKDIKCTLIKLYKENNVTKAAKASDIESIFNIRPVRKSIENKTVVGYYIP